MNLKVLQNYSDIRGITINNDINKANLNEDTIIKIISGFIQWLKNNNNQIKSIAIGRDSRLKGLEFKNAAIDTFINQKIDVVDCDLTITPALFYAIEFYKCDAAVMITASHLPHTRNGIKFFTKDGGINYNDLSNIIKIADKTNTINNEEKGVINKVDINIPYAEKIKNFIKKNAGNSNNQDKPLNNLKIIIDAGNGTGGFITTKILEPLGAITSGSINLKPDGNFPDHEPNTESLSAIKSLQKKVIENDADLGIIFDSDADRCAFVNNEGKPIIHDNFVALLTVIIAEETIKPTIVTDSITSDDLTNYIQKELGGIHHRFKRGYRKVINEAIRLNNEGINCPLAIETSGHAGFKENSFIDDGILLAAKVIIKIAKIKKEGLITISEFYNRYNSSKITRQFRLAVNSSNIEIESNRIIQTFKQFVDTVPGWKVVINNFDGVRITADKYFGDGWLLLRLSLHEPVLVLNIESGSKKGIIMILKRVVKLLSRVTTVNISTINTYISENK